MTTTMVFAVQLLVLTLAVVYHVSAQAPSFWASKPVHSVNSAELETPTAHRLSSVHVLLLHNDASPEEKSYKVAAALQQTALSVTPILKVDRYYVQDNFESLPISDRVRRQFKTNSAPRHMGMFQDHDDIAHSLSHRKAWQYMIKHNLAEAIIIDADSYVDRLGLDSLRHHWQSMEEQFAWDMVILGADAILAPVSRLTAQFHIPHGGFRGIHAYSFRYAKARLLQNKVLDTSFDAFVHDLLEAGKMNVMSTAFPVFRTNVPFRKVACADCQHRFHSRAELVSDMIRQHIAGDHTFKTTVLDYEHRSNFDLRKMPTPGKVLPFTSTRYQQTEDPQFQVKSNQITIVNSTLISSFTPQTIPDTIQFTFSEQVAVIQKPKLIPASELGLFSPIDLSYTVDSANTTLTVSLDGDAVYAGRVYYIEITMASVIALTSSNSFVTTAPSDFYFVTKQTACDPSGCPVVTPLSYVAPAGVTFSAPNLFDDQNFRVLDDIKNEGLGPGDLVDGVIATNTFGTEITKPFTAAGPYVAWKASQNQIDVTLTFKSAIVPESVKFHYENTYDQFTSLPDTVKVFAGSNVVTTGTFPWYVVASNAGRPSPPYYPGSRHGHVADFYGDHLFIGNANDNNFTTNVTGFGSVDIFVRTGATGGTYLQSLVEPKPFEEIDSLFGGGLCIRNGVLVITAAKSNGGTGRIYTYENKTTAFELIAPPLNGGSTGLVDLDETGRRMITAETSQVLVYQWSGSNWVLEASIDISTSLAVRSIAISGNGTVIAVGVPDSSGSSSVVQVYERISNLWQQTFIVPDTTGQSEFGRSVALNYRGDILAVGAPNKIITGQVSIFTKSSGSWTLLHVTSPSLDSPLRFGQSLSLYNGLLIVGLPTEQQVWYHTRSASTGLFVHSYTKLSFFPNTGRFVRVRFERGVYRVMMGGDNTDGTGSLAIEEGAGTSLLGFNTSSTVLNASLVWNNGLPQLSEIEVRGRLKNEVPNAGTGLKPALLASTPANLSTGVSLTAFNYVFDDKVDINPIALTLNQSALILYDFATGAVHTVQTFKLVTNFNGLNTSISVPTAAVVPGRKYRAVLLANTIIRDFGGLNDEIVIDFVSSLAGVSFNPKLNNPHFPAGAAANRAYLGSSSTIDLLTNMTFSSNFSYISFILGENAQLGSVGAVFELIADRNFNATLLHINPYDPRVTLKPTGTIQTGILSIDIAGLLPLTDRQSYTLYLSSGFLVNGVNLTSSSYNITFEVIDKPIRTIPTAPWVLPSVEPGNNSTLNVTYISRYGINGEVTTEFVSSSGPLYTPGIQKFINSRSNYTTQLVFAPKVTDFGSFSNIQSVVFADHVAQVASVFTVTVNASSTPPPILRSTAPVDGFDFGQVSLSSVSAPEEFFLVNSAQATGCAYIASFQVNGPFEVIGRSGPASPDVCSSFLKFAVVFTPSQVGDANGNFVVTYGPTRMMHQSLNLSINLKGTGIVQPSPIDALAILPPLSTTWDTNFVFNFSIPAFNISGSPVDPSVSFFNITLFRFGGALDPVFNRTIGMKPPLGVTSANEAVLMFGDYLEATKDTHFDNQPNGVSLTNGTIYNALLTLNVSGPCTPSCYDTYCDTKLLSAGGNRTCVVPENRQAVPYGFLCVGSNDFGESFPMNFMGVNQPWRQISAGARHTCLLASNYSGYCFGMESGSEIRVVEDGRVQGESYFWLVAGTNSSGALLKNITDRPPDFYTRFPTGIEHRPGFVGSALGFDIQALELVNTTFRAMYIGLQHACLIQFNDSVTCLGPATLTNVTKESYYMLDVSDTFSCGITTKNYVRCWGVFPGSPPSDNNYVSVATGKFHVCMITKQGNLQCFGDNSRNQTNLVSSPQHYNPSFDRFVAVDCGDYHCCAAVVNGSLFCWGDNSFGQLYVGSFMDLAGATCRETNSTSRASLSARRILRGLTFSKPDRTTSISCFDLFGFPTTVARVESTFFCRVQPRANGVRIRAYPYDLNMTAQGAVASYSMPDPFDISNEFLFYIETSKSAGPLTVDAGFNKPAIIVAFTSTPPNASTITCTPQVVGIGAQVNCSVNALDAQQQLVYVSRLEFLFQVKGSTTSNVVIVRPNEEASSVFTFSFTWPSSEEAVVSTGVGGTQTIVTVVDVPDATSKFNCAPKSSVPLDAIVQCTILPAKATKSVFATATYFSQGASPQIGAFTPLTPVVGNAIKFNYSLGGTTADSLVISTSFGLTQTIELLIPGTPSTRGITQYVNQSVSYATVFFSPPSYIVEPILSFLIAYQTGNGFVNFTVPPEARSVSFPIASELSVPPSSIFVFGTTKFGNGRSAPPSPTNAFNAPAQVTGYTPTYGVVFQVSPVVSGRLTAIVVDAVEYQKRLGNLTKTELIVLNAAGSKDCSLEDSPVAAGVNTITFSNCFTDKSGIAGKPFKLAFYIQDANLQSVGQLTNVRDVTWFDDATLGSLSSLTPGVPQPTFPGTVTFTTITVEKTLHHIVFNASASDPNAITSFDTQYISKANVLTQFLPLATIPSTGGIANCTLSPNQTDTTYCRFRVQSQIGTVEQYTVAVIRVVTSGSGGGSVGLTGLTGSFKLNKTFPQSLEGQKSVIDIVRSDLGQTLSVSTANISVSIASGSIIVTFSVIPALGQTASQLQTILVQQSSTPGSTFLQGVLTGSYIASTLTTSTNALLQICPDGAVISATDTCSNPCGASPCVNGATCQAVQGSVLCLCAPGWIGTLCDVRSWVVHTGGTEIYNTSAGTCQQASVAPFTRSRSNLTLTSRAGGEILSLVLSVQTANNVRVRFGTPSGLRFNCPLLAPFVLPQNLPNSVASYVTVCCRLSATYSTGLIPYVSFNSSVGWSPEITGQDVLAFPPPGILPNTLRLNTGAASNVIFTPTVFGDDLSFKATNLFAFPGPSVPQDIFVRFGSINNPFEGLCGNVRMGLDNVTCTLPAGEYKNKSFTIQLGQSVSLQGTDSFSTPTPPRITSVTGCANQTGSLTFNCPTGGNIPITVHGENLFSPISISVDGEACFPAIGSGDGLSAVCTLPAGAGFGASVVAFQNEQTSPPLSYDVLSYARPFITQIRSVGTDCVERPPLYTSLEQCNRLGSERITLHGSNFGATGATVFLGLGLCTNVTHSLSDPHSIIECDTPSGNTVANNILVVQKSGELSLQQDTPVSASYFQCQPGFFQPSQAPLTCEPCKNGTAQSGVGQTSCSICKPGTYTSLAQQQTCATCEAGTFQDLEGQSSCKDCPIGKATNSRGEVACTPCDVGTFANTSGLAQCRPCPEDSFQDRIGSANCSVCDHSIGRYQLVTQQSVCSKCTAGRYAVFVQDVFQQCDDCPEGVECEDGLVKSKSGFWWGVDPETGQIDSRVCNPGYCQGSNVCQDGRIPDANENKLCGECQPGFHEWGGQCINCERTRWDLLIVLFFCFFLFVVGFHRLSQVSSTAALKIVMYFLQNAFLFVGRNVLLDWLELVNFRPANSTGTAICLAPVSQLFRMALGFAMPIIAPVQLGIIMAIHYVYSKFADKKEAKERAKTFHFNEGDESSSTSRSASKSHTLPTGITRPGHHSTKSQAEIDYQRKLERFGTERVILRAPSKIRIFTSRFDAAPYYRTLIGLFVFSFNGVVVTIFEYLDCTDVPDGTSLVRAFPAVNCRDPDYQFWRWFAIGVLVLVAFGLPAFFFFKLYFGRKQKLLKDPTFVRKYGVLIDVYHNHALYWELYVLLRRAALVALVVFLADQRAQLYGALSLLNLLIFVSHSLRQPFLNDDDNTSETVSLALLTVLTIVLPMGGSPPYAEEENIVFALMVLIPGAGLLLWALSKNWGTKIKKFFSKYILKEKAPLSGSVSVHNVKGPAGNAKKSFYARDHDAYAEEGQDEFNNNKNKPTQVEMVPVANRRVNFAESSSDDESIMERPARSSDGLMRLPTAIQRHKDEIVREERLQADAETYSVLSDWVRFSRNDIVQERSRIDEQRKRQYRKEAHKHRGPRLEGYAEEFVTKDTRPKKRAPKIYNEYADIIASSSSRPYMVSNGPSIPALPGYHGSRMYKDADAPTTNGELVSQNSLTDEGEEANRFLKPSTPRSGSTTQDMSHVPNLDQTVPADPEELSEEEAPMRLPHRTPNRKRRVKSKGDATPPPSSRLNFEPEAPIQSRSRPTFGLVDDEAEEDMKEDVVPAATQNAERQMAVPKTKPSSAVELEVESDSEESDSYASDSESA